MKKQLETIATLMQELKAKFSNAEPQKFEQATLMDGTIVEWDGQLAVGTALFVVDGENRVPAPAGIHKTDAGVVITVDENGIVTEIVEEQPMSAEPQAEQMSAEQVNEIVNAKMSEVLDTFSKGFESITSAFEAMTAEHKALKEDFEAFKKLPANNKNEGQKFNRQGKDNNLTVRQQILLKNKNK